MNQFNFGQNWKDYSRHALAPEKVQEAKKSIIGLIGPISPIGHISFLDIGCGSGLFSICAKMLGAKRVVGMDVNQLCLEVAKENERTILRTHERTQIDFLTLSILDTPAIAKLGQFDIVYAWGSLHHTGNLALAIKNAASCVKSNGTFVISIYNRHWSSPIWKLVKKVYNRLPSFCKLFAVYFFYPIIALAKWITTGKNPFKKERGMTFYYDVVDWLGGYPYEYASVDEMKTTLTQLGFVLQKIVPPPTPTGCVEYVCSNTAKASRPTDRG